MEFQREMQAAKLLKAHSHIWNHIFNFINSMSLKCAVELGIPDAIHNYGQPMPLSQLIASLPIHPSKSSSIQRLMRILIHSGIFATKNVANDDHCEVGYVLTDSSMLLLKDNPLSVTPFLLAMLDPIFTKPWHKLSTWFQSNNKSTPFETEHEETLWGYASHDPKLNEIFNDAMASDARFVSKLLVDDKCKGVFEGLESLVDVGGGTGTVAKAIAKSFPQLDCTVFDLPHVAADLEGSDNLKYIGGDMFEAVPSSDAILLKSILHDWNDEECLHILKNCKEAIMSKGKGGKVIVIDMVIMEDEKKGNDVDKSVETQLFFDMLMMVLVTGKERNEKEWAELIFSAGFNNYKITPILGLRSLIEIYP
ncbi:hypothetical protein HN51_050391 [Arachis hypogaea]|uniref:isoflavone 7-O-methyltransferase n=1 Tax=Arachis hypogaea TaxID=3818 RepID=A0A444YBT4_ARAHY|nr:probable O-methyltransferase 3 [Arachis ipaensis]XP_025668800.1 probable O-methyltransferase 3 [Arachis hypogaea]QHN92127.1 uncharacterized protein DS421_17g581010 [Arachis hypogaea]RYQ99277.1 hypothetical protein Ahy_B07g087181 [Arachis hypogaea]